jgi:hypothetical protein
MPGFFMPGNCRMRDLDFEGSSGGRATVSIESTIRSTKLAV